MIEIPARFGLFGLWNFCSSSLIAAMIGPVGSSALGILCCSLSEPLVELGMISEVTAGSEIRTCFLGEVHSDQQVCGAGFDVRLLAPSWSFSSSSEVDPGNNCPRWSRFLPEMSPSQWR